jgi:hypothetical protein
MRACFVMCPSVPGNAVYRRFDGLFVCLMVFNATFNNFSVISWRSVLLVKETGRPGENHRPVARRGRRGRDHYGS